MAWKRSGVRIPIAPPSSNHGAAATPAAPFLVSPSSRAASIMPAPRRTAGTITWRQWPIPARRVVFCLPGLDDAGPFAPPVREANDPARLPHPFGT
jgi:hypothetical protein